MEGTLHMTGMKNYLLMGSGPFRLKYIYADLHANGQYVADSLLYRHKVPCAYQENMSSDREKYIIVLCKIRRKYRAAFEKAMSEIENKMYLLGHSDYAEFCDHIMKVLEDNTEPRKDGSVPELV